MDTVVPPARFDPRGLVELDERVPGTAEIDGEKATFDARELTTRQINLELRRLIYEEGVSDVTVRNPGARHSLGVDCVPGEWTDADTEFVTRKFSIYELGSPPELQKFVCGKKLYNYDSLEPSERKLVL